jgi:hypothetical protein
LEHLHLKEVNQSFVHIFLIKLHLHHKHKLHQNPLLQNIRKLFRLSYNHLHVSILEIRNQNLENIAFFKCGLNCTYHEGMKLEVCEKMLSSTDK